MQGVNSYEEIWERFASERRLEFGGHRDPVEDHDVGVGSGGRGRDLDGGHAGQGVEEDVQERVTAADDGHGEVLDRRSRGVAVVVEVECVLTFEERLDPSAGRAVGRDSGRTPDDDSQNCRSFGAD